MFLKTFQKLPEFLTVAKEVLVIFGRGLLELS